MSAWAKVGVRCVCIDDAWTYPNMDIYRVPMLNEVLTISDGATEEGGRTYLWFEEIPFDQGDTTSVRFCSSHFRPLVSTKTQTEDLAKHFDKLLITDAITRLDVLLESLDE